MPSNRAVQTQGNFIGGLWDQVSHGRIDHPWHKAALALCTNAVPLENGSWCKRSGTQWLGPTYKRLQGYVRTFTGDSNNRYSVVVTTDGSTGWAHFFHKDAVLTNASDTVVGSSSSAGVLTITTAGTTGWSSGDQVIFSSAPVSGGPYLNLWCTITAISGTSLTVQDDQGNAFGFDTSTNALFGATISRIARYTTGFLANLNTVRCVNIGIQTYGGPIEALLLCSGYAPQLIQMSIGASVTISVGAATFTDGPYLDAQPDTGTVSGYSGSITFTPGSTTFTANDVGRQIRLFSQPAAWSSSTAYSNGDLVTYNGSWWQYVGGASYAAISGVIPGTLYTTSTGVQVLLWAPFPTAGQWAYGTISAQATTSCTVSLTTNLASANGSTISSWRLGAFTATAAAYPTSGILYEGRLWLGGAREGRIDASMSGSLLTFSPTDTYGNVFDNHAIDENLSAQSQDMIRWFAPDRSGLLFGTVAEEYIATGGGNNDPITPSNFLFRRMSRYGTATGGATAVHAGFAVVFIQTGTQIVYEYVTDAFTTAPSGRVLNEFCRQIGDLYGGLGELAYCETRVPLVWATTNLTAAFASCTYRRFSRFMSQPADMAGWALHELADLKRAPVSLSAVSFPDLDNDYLYITTAKATGGVGFANGVEVMQPMVTS